MLRGMKAPASVYAFLALGTVVISQSGNIIRLSGAHPVAIAAWRLGLAGMLLMVFYGRRLGELKKLTRRELLLLLLSGVFLAFHFFTWIAAVQHTTVANAAIFFSANPVLVAGRSSSD
jgi:drug/metabolite transporter (DMT)-like permease